MPAEGHDTGARTKGKEPDTGWEEEQDEGGAHGRRKERRAGWAQGQLCTEEARGCH